MIKIVNYGNVVTETLQIMPASAGIESGTSKPDNVLLKSYVFSFLHAHKHKHHDNNNLLCTCCNRNIRRLSCKRWHGIWCIQIHERRARAYFSYQCFEYRDRAEQARRRGEYHSAIACKLFQFRHAYLASNAQMPPHDHDERNQHIVIVLMTKPHRLRLSAGLSRP